MAKNFLTETVSGKEVLREYTLVHLRLRKGLEQKHICGQVVQQVKRELYHRNNQGHYGEKERSNMI